MVGSFSLLGKLTRMVYVDPSTHDLPASYGLPMSDHRAVL